MSNVLTLYTCIRDTHLVANARVPDRRRLIYAHAVTAKFRRLGPVAIVLSLRTVQTVPVGRADALVTAQRVFALRAVLTSEVRLSQPHAFVHINLTQSAL